MWSMFLSVAVNKTITTDLVTPEWGVTGRLVSVVYSLKTIYIGNYSVRANDISKMLKSYTYIRKAHYATFYDISWMVFQCCQYYNDSVLSSLLNVIQVVNSAWLRHFCATYCITALLSTEQYLIHHNAYRVIEMSRGGLGNIM